MTSHHVATRHVTGHHVTSHHVPTRHVTAGRSVCGRSNLSTRVHTYGGRTVHARVVDVKAEEVADSAVAWL